MNDRCPTSNPRGPLESQQRMEKGEAHHPGACSTKPGHAILYADSYTAGRPSDSKRRASTLSMRPYSIASAAVMK
jgi:hypothetical protein